MKAIIIDDEPLARQLIESFLIDSDQIEIVAQCGDGFEGVKAIQELKPDLIFLDVQMPKINGFEMLELLTDPPGIIFTTAFDEFAIKAFEANAIDYLLKPFSKARLKAAIEKFERHFESGNQTNVVEELENFRPLHTGENNRIVVKDGTEITIIPVEQIEYLEAYGDYIKVHYQGKMILKKKP